MEPRSEVFNCDCLEFMKKQTDNCFDLAIVDPPYGLPKDSTHGRGKLKDRSLNRGNIQKWDIKPTKEYFEELFRVSKNQIIWGGNYFELPPCRCFVCWDKEQVWENFSQCEFAWTSFQKPAKMIRLANRGGDADKAKFHPTAKNVKLYEYLLKTFANKGDTVFDSHMGSGPSRIAAYKMGFDFIGCEIDEEYFRLADERFRRECLYEYTLKDGRTTKQLELF